MLNVVINNQQIVKLINLVNYNNINYQYKHQVKI
jgi:hypothetical protein